MINLLDGNEENDIKDTVYEINELNSKGVTVKRDKPTAGWVLIKKGQVKDYSFKMGDYIVNYDDDIKKPKAVKNGTLKDKPSVSDKVVKLIDTNNNNKADIGETIIIGSEKFYVISNNDTTINMLAYYNLYLGNIYTSDYILDRTISPTEEGYGRQNENAKGWINGDNVKYIGTVAFSNTNG